MRKVLPIILLVLVSASCKKMIEPIRIQMPGTYWSYSVGDQTARVTFPDGRHASVLQKDLTSHACQALHGTYSTDGHRVLLTGENWPSEIRFVRTFSHLKNNSTNKNMTPLSPVAHSNLAGSVWATMADNNLNLVFFDHDGTCVDATYRNVIHKEGTAYGWKWGRREYLLSGDKLTVGSVTGTLYEDFIQVDTVAVFNAAPEQGGTATSALNGTVWTYDTAGFPGLLIFTSGSTFTRVLVSSGIVYYTLNGTYQLSGTSLTMTDGADINETCQLSADRFTFLEKDYVKVTLP